MDSTGKIWVALDTGKIKALKIAKTIASNPAIFGFKLNRLIDQEVFRKDGEPALFDELAQYGLPLWVDLKFHDVPRTVIGRLMPYIESGQIQFLTVMAKGEIDMMTDAVEAMGEKGHIIAVTELTSSSEEQIHLGSGQPSKASVITLARNAVLSGVRHLVSSSQELGVLSKRRELAVLKKFVPGITPDWKKGESQPDQKRVGSPAFALIGGADKIVIGGAIVNDEDPLGAVEKTASEIEAIN
ncbi:MAG: Orotidine 5'-phosphate decarboxylase [Candidatus Moranbacteria bacterium GW2011_GWE1_35_17]|nr:MAG: Orotidine 5'-phosphate decarboxylase [Candidatus Moranbacteria bacterium GW2011_GWE1_35_17]KKP72860.1 MAG: Orotidine 5'-phosphate decarboxylase [Candidatus Moranbacteria bacterium GW2011_GWE2_35_164]KKP84081.1 MAG: Orotidine 5'-phosphate decarboxylase [Candidatus Moranbacteria bacterium GW2011_GWF1_35_5]KKP85039.1 MAG: Orotidine 5'-phosphate decarboxylase [Candidatus Moranbacteria bacterium GW2011_GWF2_35_54]